MSRGAGPTTRYDRRSVLATVGSAAVGLVGGCLGSDDDRVRVLAAGSLAVVLEEHVGPAFQAEAGIRYAGEYHGSNALMRMIEERTKHPDVVISADVDLLRERLYPDHADWDVEFATNAVGIAYDPSADVGGRLADGEPWYEVLADAGPGEVAISDPDLDPLGYRAVLLFELAEREHGLEGFRETMVDRAYREPNESALLAGIEAGDRACAVCYRNMASDHGVPFLGLPDAYNFANPAYADRYERVTYTTADGYTVSGSPVVYNATVRTGADEADAGRSFVTFLLDRPELLAEHGLRVPDALPRWNGDPPEGLDG
ncbi:extracellular solute-binding protein [Halosolutus amylolyticus]|uniref:Extracellular solute-binding protein n=1 Tax=Halosolutus amylolyticus TaxID=2932267 RepID=A0ABD5PW15_9EURY|nr:extracellular solute-binding protein [Halosolutus amylolyticus]